MSHTNDCMCATCLHEKRMDFLDGKEVRIRGDKIIDYMDITIVENNEEKRAVIGFSQNTKVSDILVAIAGLTHYARQLIQEEVAIDVSGVTN